MMRINMKVNLGAVLLFLLISPTIGSNTTAGSRLVDRRQFALKFGDTLEDFIMFQPDMSPLQNAMTVCSWIKKLSTNSRPTWLSYATSSHSHEIFISDNGNRNFFLEGSNLDLSSKMTPSIGTWNHHCTSWSTSSNTRKVYFNGELVGQGATTSRTLGLNGILFFGNERHYDGGSLDQSEIFGGELFKVNFFAKELTGEEILAMKEAGLCSDVEEGYGRVRYLRWEDLLLEQRTGNITEVDPGCPARHCETETGNETEEPTPGTRDSRSDGGEKNGTVCECVEREEITRWDILYSEEFYNRTLTGDLLEQLRSYWDVLGHFVGTTITEGVITHFKIFHSSKESCSDRATDSAGKKDNSS